MTPVPPLQREILLDAGPELAFTVFTERIGEWWPLDGFSVHGAGGSVRFAEPAVGGEIVESREGAADAVWGTVTAWQPPTTVAFTWHPAQDPGAASHVTVTFEPADGRTQVRLVHRGWEAYGDLAAQARAEYDQGWPAVLDAYARLAAARSGSADR